MKKTFITIWILFLSFCSGAQLRLPALVSDDMVLQRESILPIFGWDKPGQQVQLEFINKKYKTKTGADGKWEISLPALKPGGPYKMKINGSEEKILKNILIGDVYLCAGQSNMVHSLGLHKDRYKKEIEAAAYPFIRQFTVPTQTSLDKEMIDLQNGQWMEATRKHIEKFSVVAYFFAKEIHETQGIPIGIINASVGGTPIESWMSEEALMYFPSSYQVLQRNKDSAYVNSLNRMAAEKNRKRPAEDDRGLKENTKWFDPALDDSAWDDFQLPGYWEDQGQRDLNGIVWFRKEIILDEKFTGKKIRLNLGRIVDADQVFVNGKEIGKTTYQYPQRRYDLDEGVLKPGRNLIAVRVTNFGGKGGFVPGKPYQLATASDTVSLQGKWKFKTGDVFIQDMNWHSGLNLQNQPAALYRGMIHPLTGFALKGMIWYQGESNTHNAAGYGTLLRALIFDWRKQFRQEDLPFMFVQLPNFNEVSYTSDNSSWAVLRNEQRRTLSIPGTAMAVAIDLGEWNDIHPGNKKDIGIRLSLAARNMIYGEKSLVHSGPLFRNAYAKDDSLVVEFDHTGSGLISIDGKEPSWFYLASADKKFHPAKTRIENHTVIVWNESISDPVTIRYAWADNPEGANLYNREGLPASPFEAMIRTEPGSEHPWNGKKAAVVLTYDDALQVHLTNALPALDAAGLKASFYVSDQGNTFRYHMPAWKAAAASGHELGNHTMFHPCLGNIPGREWVRSENDLSKYSIERINNEIRSMNNLLTAMDGKHLRTFAYPCSDTRIRDSFYLHPSKDLFVAARAVRNEMVELNDADLFNLPSYMVNGESGAELIALAQKALEEKKLLIFLFHGVGGEHSLNVSLQAHNELLAWLQQQQDEIWIAPLVEIASYISFYQNKNSLKQP